MRIYIRNYVPGGTYFFTLVTCRRRPLLASHSARCCLRFAFRQARAQWPFEIIAIVLLPDYLHMVMSLPVGNADFSLRVRKVKALFTETYRRSVGSSEAAAFRRAARGERNVWQPRFWEHTVRDEADLKRCVDYVHWNPMKHGLVRRVMDYPWSSYHRYVRMGEYAGDWGDHDPCPGFGMPE